jgi:hypothetical protein
MLKSIKLYLKNAKSQAKSSEFCDNSRIRLGKPLHFRPRLNVEGWLISQAVGSSALVDDAIPEEKGILLVEKGREKLLEHPRVDPLWIAFDKALTRGIEL